MDYGMSTINEKKGANPMTILVDGTKLFNNCATILSVYSAEVQRRVAIGKGTLNQRRDY